MQAIRLLLVLSSLLLALSGCAPTPTRPSAPPQIAAGQAEGAALEARGEYAAAAALYRQLAQGSAAPWRQDLLLLAARALLADGAAAEANALLTELGLSELSAGQAEQLRLLRAEAELALGRPDQALARLGSAPPADGTLERRRAYHRLRAEALADLGRHWDSALELIEMDPWLEPPERLENQLAIVAQLNRMPQAELLAPRAYQPELSGWLALAVILRTPGADLAQAEPRIADWRLRHPGHPALPELPQAWFTRLQAEIYRPRQIAVLLPESGRFQWVSGALRAGILAAYFEQPPAERPSLRFYDSADPNQIWPLFQQAVADGAEMVLGPLDKDAVIQLARAGELPVPVLALNQVPPEPGFAAELYQFALAPEDEARQAAERAWSQGFSRALVLTPADDWGERLYASFRERWLELGGGIADHQRYDPQQRDYSDTLRALLDLDLSNARLQEMQRLLGRNLEFEPRRRADAEFVFVAARPDPARALRPQLQFHHAGDLPVLASSHLFEGERNPARDRDLDGISFPDLPWLFDQAPNPGLSRDRLAATLPDFSQRLARFYAMGIDSYILVPHLARLRRNPGSGLDANTGQLYLDNLNRVHRRLTWARFVDGIPQPVDPLPAPAPPPSGPATEPTTAGNAP
jgi:outer membrane PBP1 activator LpoA protein